ncbi:unannotated protein [freshwater metagenome]|uniref:Unannotated protein n=1 Tax=freshwater metagenome TaxID=449393 RepID=A0A6J7C3I7_9ZZZZ
MVAQVYGDDVSAPVDGAVRAQAGEFEGEGREVVVSGSVIATTSKGFLKQYEVEGCAAGRFDRRV